MKAMKILHICLSLLVILMAMIYLIVPSLSARVPHYLLVIAGVLLLSIAVHALTRQNDRYLRWISASCFMLVVGLFLAGAFLMKTIDNILPHLALIGASALVIGTLAYMIANDRFDYPINKKSFRR